MQRHPWSLWVISQRRAGTFAISGGVHLIYGGVHQIYIYIYRWLNHIKTSTYIPFTYIEIFKNNSKFSHSFPICSTDFWLVNFWELAAFLCLGGGAGAIPSDASVRNRKKKWWGASDGKTWWDLETHFFGRLLWRFPAKKGITFHGEVLHNC